MSYRISRSSRRFLERAGIIDTRRGPVAKFSDDNRVHHYPVDPPLPSPHLLEGTDETPSPDRGATTVWPHGTAGEAAE